MIPAGWLIDFRIHHFKDCCWLFWHYFPTYLPVSIVFQYHSDSRARYKVRKNGLKRFFPSLTFSSYGSSHFENLRKIGASLHSLGWKFVWPSRIRVLSRPLWPSLFRQGAERPWDGKRIDCSSDFVAALVSPFRLNQSISRFKSVPYIFVSDHLSQLRIKLHTLFLPFSNLSDWWVTTSIERPRVVIYHFIATTLPTLPNASCRVGELCSLAQYNNNGAFIACYGALWSFRLQFTFFAF